MIGPILPLIAANPEATMRRKVAANVEASASQTSEWLPPPHLPPAAATIWRETLAALAPGHFAAADEALFADYCHQVAMLRELRSVQARVRRRTTTQQAAARAIDTDVDRAMRGMLALCRALRLSPLGRRSETDTSLPPTNDNRQRHRLAPVHTFEREAGPNPYLP
ncbi:hypothetical protein [Cupriavidus pauculus]|uniref:Uncharacterized protein n=1 Tax=Cupriavidus pauculus TaxID=82633 RepID=A0A2N5C920_9BURK|nr:hypothetical protein [Cupriavidus pauculus]PLP98706.1 hypothetical protein CYJ10_20615 [Cupriavidus pauculus]